MANLIDSAFSHINEVMEETRKHIKSVQENPIGYEKRSKKEFGIMMKKLSSMKPEERADKINSLAMLAGHDFSSGLDDCSLCKIIKNSQTK